MKLTDQLTDYVNACFTGLWIQTHEPDEAEREIALRAQENSWRIAVWDVANGLRLPARDEGASGTPEVNDPLAAQRALPALADNDGTAILLLHNFHRFLGNPEVIQTTFHQLIQGKQQRTFFVVLAPVAQIPVELEKLFVVLEHQLPDRDQLEQIAREVTSDEPDDLPDDLSRILDASAGLTRYEAEGAFALSIARRNEVRPGDVWELKAQALKKNNLLTLHRGEESFAGLGGLQSLKDFSRRALTNSNNSSRSPQPPRSRWRSSAIGQAGAASMRRSRASTIWTALSHQDEPGRSVARLTIDCRTSSPFSSHSTTFTNHKFGASMTMTLLVAVQSVRTEKRPEIISVPRLRRAYGE